MSWGIVQGQMHLTLSRLTIFQWALISGYDSLDSKDRIFSIISAFTGLPVKLRQDLRWQIISFRFALIPPSQSNKRGRERRLLRLSLAVPH